jgi:hypothetical protein
MVTLYREPTWKIAVYGREHGVPHFHIEGRGHRCTVALATLEVIVGEVPPAVLQSARVWAVAHSELLMRTWRELNP